MGGWDVSSRTYRQGSGALLLLGEEYGVGLGRGGEEEEDGEEEEEGAAADGHHGLGALVCVGLWGCVCGGWVWDP